MRFDGDAFKKSVSDVVNRDIQSTARNLQDIYDRVLQTGHGKSVAQVKQLLRQEARRAGLTLTDPELSDMADALSKGQRIEVRADKYRL